MNQNMIRVRVCMAVVEAGRILLVPHYDTDAGAVQWNLPGGRVEFGESLRRAATREFTEETGLQVAIIDLLDVSEVLIPERPWHSITISFQGALTGGTLRSEIHPVYGSKTPEWFSWQGLDGRSFHPAETIRKAFERLS